MILGHALNRETLVIDGISRDVPRALLLDWGDDVGRITEESIATDFEDEVAAGKALKEVSEQHEQRKAADGLDSRLGHMTGNLQDELDAGGFYKVTAGAGRVTIKLDEELLIARVEYAGWFAESQVRGGRILVVLPKHAKVAAEYMRKRVDDWERGQKRRRSA